MLAEQEAAIDRGDIRALTSQQMPSSKRGEAPAGVDSVSAMVRAATAPMRRRFIRRTSRYRSLSW